ncbi:MAG: transglycosylase SLT domain-containing protein [Ignavibacteria bacterium]|nr:transglycosylase SLT domain-containing protein [Ignavibacteria bacterium]
MIKLSKKKLFILLIILFLSFIIILSISENEQSKKRNEKQELSELFKSKNTFLKYEDFQLNKINFRNNLSRLFTNWYKIFDIFYLNLNRYKYISYEEDIQTDESGKIKFPQPKIRFFKGNIDGIINNFGEIIIEHCNEYKIDWRLILAIIHQESYFDSMAVSRAGAYGLMQLMPRTGFGLQAQLNLDDYKSAKNNIIAGIYYFATLVNSFESVGEDKYKFALAAYNAGFGRVVDAMTLAAYDEKNYKNWDEVKEYLPLLSSRYDTLTKGMFQAMGRQRSPILNNWKEPYLYVEYVYYYYERYKEIFESNLKEKKQKTKKKKKT